MKLVARYPVDASSLAPPPNDRDMMRTLGTAELARGVMRGIDTPRPRGFGQAF